MILQWRTNLALNCGNIERIQKHLAWTSNCHPRRSWESGMQKSLTSERVMRWRLCIEEFSPDSIHLQGTDNQAANAVRRFPLSTSDPSDELKMLAPAKVLSKCQTNECPETMEQFFIDFCAEHFNIEEDPDWNPVTFSELAKEIQCLAEKDVGNWVMPTHQQHFSWGGERETTTSGLSEERSVCQQRCKKELWIGTTTNSSIQDTHKKERQLVNTSGGPRWETMPDNMWGNVQHVKRTKESISVVDTCLPKKQKWCLGTMCVLTSLVLMRSGERNNLISNVTEQEWFNRCHWPTQMTCDRENEFLGKNSRDWWKKHERLVHHCQESTSKHHCGENPPNH